MQIYATGEPRVEVNDESIVVAFPTGSGEPFEVRLDLHQAVSLAQRSLRVTALELNERRKRPVPACAQILAFKRASA